EVQNHLLNLQYNPEYGNMKSIIWSEQYCYDDEQKHLFPTIFRWTNTDFLCSRKSHYCCRDKIHSLLKQREYVLRKPNQNYSSIYRDRPDNFLKNSLANGFCFHPFPDKKSEDLINQIHRQFC